MDKKDKDMKVLVIGGGGRCHAIVDALSRSESVAKIYAAPGNAGIGRQAECVAIGVTDIPALLDFARSHDIDLTIVGPEAPLAMGIVDRFREAGLRVFGPTQSAARIESSKQFAKDLMARHGIPTASYRTFTDYDEALAYVKAGSIPVVIKYDGLAAGKGVVVALTLAEAEDALRDMLLDGTFGEGKVVVEEFLDGPEFSFMCIVNGTKVYPLAIARDHKRAYDHDRGPNTGGMGAYSPVPFVTNEIRETALNTIIRPVAEAMVEEGYPFTGVLYGGLILHRGVPKVIEFNARFGDPETEVVLPKLTSDLGAGISAILNGETPEFTWDESNATLGVVIASNGYPENVIKGARVPEIEVDEDSHVYYAGVASDEHGNLVANSGRVLLVETSAPDIKSAQDKVYAIIDKLELRGLFYRHDIGFKALK